MTPPFWAQFNKEKQNKPKGKLLLYQLLQYNFVLILYFGWFVI